MTDIRLRTFATIEFADVVMTVTETVNGWRKGDMLADFLIEAL